MSVAVRHQPRASRSGGSTRNVNADIDETLFSQTQKQGNRGSAGLQRNGTAIVSAKTLHALGATGGSAAKESVIISNADLHSILALTGRIDPSATHHQHNNSSTRQQLSSTAAARKEKMLRIEREAASRVPVLSQSEFEEKENRQRLLGQAKQAMDEEMDDVKHMNQMMLYAQCATIRDAQILEKQRIQDALLAEEKRMDLAMEIERVRTLKLMEERDAARAEEQRLGASVIITQIQEREQDRIRQQELREQEAGMMLQRVKEAEEKEEVERRNKVIVGRKLLEQVMDANHDQARRKLLKKQEEIDEDLRIQNYIRTKEKREAENEKELLRVRAEKEKEIARLRAMQERAQDREAAIDELRARRYQEAKDRSWRQSEIETAEKRDAMKQSISYAREQQRHEKSRRIAEQALIEREEYMKVLRVQKEQNELDQHKYQTALQQQQQHRQDIQQQMALKEREKYEARQRYLSEGKIFQQQNDADKTKLEELKKEKLEMMQQMGIPQKYRAELAKKKLLVASIH